jgi:hypothetical protein
MENIEQDAWEQMEGEPEIWYRRFNVYRLMGPSRNISKAYKNWRAGSGKNEKARAGSEWFTESSRWKWKERADAWDADVSQELENDAARIYGDGLSLAHNRVDKLKLIAQKLEDFILDANTTRLSPFILEQYRGILDDIAKEKGERLKETRITGATGGAILIETSWGRGGAASEAWKKIEAPIVDTIVEEITEDTIDTKEDA